MNWRNDRGNNSNFLGGEEIHFRYKTELTNCFLKLIDLEEKMKKKEEESIKSSMKIQFLRTMNDLNHSEGFGRKLPQAKCLDLWR